MKAFLVYTALRMLLFAAAFVVVAGIWMALDDEVQLVWALVIAFAVSGIASYFLLNRYREDFAQRVQAGAERATARFEESKAREDSSDS